MSLSLSGRRTASWVTTCAVFATACGSVPDASPDASGPDGGAPDARVLDAAMPDAPILDAAPPDASPPVAYEVAYVNEMTFDADLGVVDVASFGLLVNAGELPLDLSTAKVLTFSDDNATVGYEFSLDNDADAQLHKGEAAGALSPLAQQVIISSGLVTEPVVDDSVAFRLNLTNIPTGNFDITARAVLSINDAPLTLEFQIHLESGASTQFSATRVGNFD
ncbi:hypothetical protein [Haliangium sp.]|uniref:hypothetical protein n=1 Tax=Haliangium sp. TaxID=2663208 RepID=UPI003D14E19D